jgi:hypothetical protein
MSTNEDTPMAFPSAEKAQQFLTECGYEVVDDDGNPVQSDR